MKKPITYTVLSFSAFLISGCALPVPLQVASWALDGVSYVMTEKSITDHGLSAVAQKDCAVWRGFTEGELCRDWIDQNETLITALAGPGDVSAAWAHKEWRVALLDTNLPEIQLKPVQRQLPREKLGEFEAIDYPNGSSINYLASAPSIPIYYESSVEPVEGIYFVIGSFRSYGKARHLASNHSQLLPTVLTAKLRNSSVYRVVVGPVESGNEKATHRRIAQVGFQDTWSIRVQPGDWSLANGSIKQVQRTQTNPELAKLPQ